MKKVNVLAVMIAVLSVPAALTDAAAGGMPNVQVLGEKLDSGLGDLDPSYAAAEFTQAARSNETRVLGEKLDSGLGELGPSYAAAEFTQPARSNETRVLGEKLDSGLGTLTYEDVMKGISTAGRTMSASGGR